MWGTNNRWRLSHPLRRSTCRSQCDPLCKGSVFTETQYYICKSRALLPPWKNSPCADLIIEKQIPRIVIGCQDPFSKVAGKGIQKLRDAGCEVIVGVLKRNVANLYGNLSLSIPFTALTSFWNGQNQPMVSSTWNVRKDNLSYYRLLSLPCWYTKKSRVGRYHGRYANRTTGQSGTHGTQLVRTQSGANSDGP